MTCDAIRVALLAGADATWPPGALAHLAGCETCTALAVEITLQRAPAVVVPATFAADVARRARLDVRPTATSPRGLIAGVCAAVVSMGAATAWLGTVDAPDAAVQAAVLLLAGAEALVLVVWAFQSDVLRAHQRG